MAHPRRAGSPWRILAHEYLGNSGETTYGRAFDISNNPQAPARRAETLRQLAEINPAAEVPPDDTAFTVCEGSEFDELVVGRWIHLEQMNTGQWWMNVGGVTINVTADRDGRPKMVDVYGPGDYAEPVEGCKYRLDWSAEDEG